jgi:radical SAM superfamily enzyme YgiQ (UPF0313 family)
MARLSDEILQLDRRAPVFLIYPPLPSYSYKIRMQDRESLALGYLVAALEAEGVAVNAINAELMELSNNEVVDLVAGCPETVLVGISAGSERAFMQVERMAADIKSRMPNVHITIGGIFATSASEDILHQTRYIDSVSLGEGEKVIHNLYAALARGEPLSTVAGVRFISDGKIFGAESPRIKNLDSLPFPARRDLAYMLGPGGPGVRRAKVSTSRGCYARCSFCSIHEIFGNHLVYRRTPSSIVAELKSIIERFKINRFTFMDDLFITPSRQGREWVVQFCNAVITEKLNIEFVIETRADTIDRELVDLLIAAGMHGIFVGIEAGSPGVLEKMQKDITAEENLAALQLLRSSSLDRESIRFGYIMFTSDMTFDELTEQYLWIKQSGFCRVQTLQNRMNAYRGTPEYRRLEEAGKLRKGDLGELASYEFDDPRVGALEADFRKFHKFCVQEVFTTLHDVQHRYLVFKQTRAERDVTRNGMSQLLRKIEGMERHHYYDYFDAAIFGCPDDVERVKAMRLADIGDLELAITVLNEMIDRYEQGTSWRLSRGEGENYAIYLDRVVLEFEHGFVGPDLYDSSCVLRMANDAEMQGAEQGLRELA